MSNSWTTRSKYATQILAPKSSRALAVRSSAEWLRSQTTKRKLERAYSLNAWDLILESKRIQLTPGQRRQQIVTLQDLHAWRSPSRSGRNDAASGHLRTGLSSSCPSFWTVTVTPRRRQRPMPHSNRFGAQSSKITSAAKRQAGLAPAVGSVYEPQDESAPIWRACQEVPDCPIRDRHQLRDRRHLVALHEPTSEPWLIVTQNVRF